MAPKAAPRHGHVPHHDDEPSARDQEAEDLPPHPVQLVQKGLVVLYVAELAGGVLVALQGPVGRGGHHQVDRGLGEGGQHLPGVPHVEAVNSKGDLFPL